MSCLEIVGTRYSFAAIGCLSVVGCSLINKPDAVLDDVPSSTSSGGTGLGGSAGEASGGNGGDTTSAGGSTSSSSATDAGGSGGSGTSVTTGTSAGGAAGAAGETAITTTDAGGSGGTGGTAPTLPSMGLVVVGGRDSADSDTPVLSVLASATGTELASETLQVAGVAYDGAPGRDVWFVFTSGEFPASPLQPVDLEIRRFDDGAKVWTTLSKATSIPPPRPGQFSVLNDRLVYLSYRLVNNAPVEHVTILDTANLASIEVIPTEFTTTSSMLGITGARGSANDPDALGGIVDLMLAENCPSQGSVVGCDLVVSPLFVGSSETPGSAVNLSDLLGTTLQGPAAFYTARLGEATHIAMPNEDGRVAMIEADPRAPSDFIDFAPTTGTDVGGLAISECNQVAAFTKTAAQALYAFNPDGGFGSTAALGQEGQALHYDAWEEQLIVTYDPADPSATDPVSPYIRAFTTVRDGVGVIITERSEFSAPPELVPETLATRVVLPIVCD